MLLSETITDVTSPTLTAEAEKESIIEKIRNWSLIKSYPQKKAYAFFS
jgi:hypothetical protein